MAFSFPVERHLAPEDIEVKNKTHSGDPLSREQAQDICGAGKDCAHATPPNPMPSYPR